MIRLFQDGMEKIVITKYQIPWGGIFVMLTFGLYELLTYDHSFGIFYFFFPLIYGTIYLVSKRNVFITFLLSFFIYLL